MQVGLLVLRALVGPGGPGGTIPPEQPVDAGGLNGPGRFKRPGGPRGRGRTRWSWIA